MIKRILWFIGVFNLVVLVFAQSTKVSYPAHDIPVITITVPDTWNVSVESAYLTFYPKDNTETGNMFAMIWKSDDPEVEDALTVLTNESFDLVEKMLIDLTWDEDVSDFQINDVDVVAIDGWGTFVNEIGTKDEMMTTIMILFPDEVNLLTLVYIGSEVAYMKHREEFMEIIRSISPYE